MNRIQEIYHEAEKYFIGGASAGQRYNAVLKQPLYISRADGSQYIDYHTCAGAGLFGHNHPRIREAIGRAMDMGFFHEF